MTASDDADAIARRLADESPTAWFEVLYAAAERGEAVVPWDRGAAHPLFADWVDRAAAEGRAVAHGKGKRAVVVGCGRGWDAELVAGLGYDTTAFDVSQTAIEATRRIHPGSSVHYLAADLLDFPPAWREAFELVIEIFTVQALPEAIQPEATRQVSSLVAPGGTLLVIASVREEPREPVEGPPWPLTRAGVEAFATDDLRLTDLQRLDSPTAPGSYRWRAQFDRA